MKRTLFYIKRGSIVWSIIVIILYLIYSFKHLSFNFARWPADERAVCAAFAVIAVLVAWISSFFMSIDEEVKS